MIPTYNAVPFYNVVIERTQIVWDLGVYFDLMIMAGHTGTRVWNVNIQQFNCTIRFKPLYSAYVRRIEQF